MKKILVFLCATALVFGVVGIVKATLYDRGGGMVYVSDQKITFLQDSSAIIFLTVIEKWMLQYVGLQLKPIHNSLSSIHPL